VTGPGAGIIEAAVVVVVVVGAGSAAAAIVVAAAVVVVVVGAGSAAAVTAAAGANDVRSDAAGASVSVAANPVTVPERPDGDSESAVVSFLELMRAPPVLTTVPAGAFVGLSDVAAASEDEFEVGFLGTTDPFEPRAACAPGFPVVPDADARGDEPAAPWLDDEFESDGSAHAFPGDVATAAPITSATAHPAIRLIYAGVLKAIPFGITSSLWPRPELTIEKTLPLLGQFGLTGILMCAVTKIVCCGAAIRCW
jgi:hypothetical protein